MDSGDVELEWLENPVATVTEVSHPFQERESSGESSGTLSTSLELLTCRVSLKFLK